MRPLVLEDIKCIEEVAKGHYLISNNNLRIGNMVNNNVHNVVLSSFKDILLTIKSLITPAEFVRISGPEMQGAGNNWSIQQFQV